MGWSGGTAKQRDRPTPPSFVGVARGAMVGVALGAAPRNRRAAARTRACVAWRRLVRRGGGP
eukprot:4306058-Prymnesium_polylepis.1